jgi:hypothetical protein
MLKTVPCVVLTSLKASTYSEYASAFPSLRPSNELVLSILQLSRIAVLYPKRSRIVSSEIRATVHERRSHSFLKAVAAALIV